MTNRNPCHSRRVEIGPDRLERPPLVSGTSLTVTPSATTITARHDMRPCRLRLSLVDIGKRREDLEGDGDPVRDGKVPVGQNDDPQMFLRDECHI